MDKISINSNFEDSINSREAKLKEVRKYIEKTTGFKLQAVRFSNGKVIAKAKNNYEAIEIRMKMQKYLEENNTRII